MDDFIFKVPKLPEDSFIGKRKGNFLRRNDFGTWNEFQGERINSFQASLFNRRDVFGNQEQLQPLREDKQEELAQPSTSQGSQGMGFNGRPNLANATVGGGQHHSVFNLVNRPRLSQSTINDQVYGKNINFSSSHNSHHGSSLGLTYKNSFQNKFDMCRGINSVNSFEQRLYLGGNGTLEASQSSLMGMRKSVFGTETFPRKCGMEGHIIFNESRNNFNSGMSTFDCLTKGGTIHKETDTLSNTNQSVLDNQSVMKSVLQISLVSMKEQIMNKLENLGHTLLRNAPGMETSFIQAAKDIKNILENSTLINPVSNATGMMSFVSYSSAAVGPQQSLFQGETNKKQSEDIKKPSSILQNLVTKKNDSQKIELVKSFKINQKKRDENCIDLSFHECTTTENFNHTSRKADGKKELNLRNWCPIFQKNSLAFTGVNEENIQIKTETVKKRINNRRVLLENGSFCNLIGSPSTEKKFPTSLLSCIKNGLTARWKMLAESLANFQQNLKKQKDKIMEDDVTTTTIKGYETVSTKKTSLKISNGNNRCKKPKSDETKSKIENSGKKRCHSPVEKHPVKMQKTDSPKSGIVDEPGVEDGTTERVLCITKSGRIVKRPKDIFSGGNSKENIQPKKNNVNEGEQEKEEEKKDQQTRKTKDARVRKPKEKVKDKVREETKSSNMILNCEVEDIYKSPKAVRVKGKVTKNVSSKTVRNGNCNTNSSDNPWGHDMDGLDDIIVPNISIHHEEIRTDPKKLLLSMETPPLKNMRSNLAFLKSYTPVQSPDWQTSRHTRSAVKKFEKFRAQAFRTKIPKENDGKKEKSKKTIQSNKDVDTVLNWISEREVRGPKKCSNIINYIMPKRNELEDTEEDSVLRDEEET